MRNTLPYTTKKGLITPQAFLATLPNAPSADQIATWKSQAPNHRIEIFTADGKDAYIIRGLTGLEFTQIQKKIQSEQPNDPELAMQVETMAKGILWKTNPAIMGTLNGQLFSLIVGLSDFMDAYIFRPPHASL